MLELQRSVICVSGWEAVSVWILPSHTHRHLDLFLMNRHYSWDGLRGTIWAHCLLCTLGQQLVHSFSSALEPLVLVFIRSRCPTSGMVMVHYCVPSPLSVFSVETPGAGHVHHIPRFV